MVLARHFLPHVTQFVFVSYLMKHVWLQQTDLLTILTDQNLLNTYTVYLYPLSSAVTFIQLSQYAQ